MDILEILLDSCLDVLKLIPFLFLTYLLMEYLEHKTNNKLLTTIQKTDKFGPFIGALLGLVPQCGFSAASTTLYSGKLITLGTLIAIYLTTSDEMIPILLTSKIPLLTIIAILAIKFVIAIIVGFSIDFIYYRVKQNKAGEKAKKEEITKLCEEEHCHCSHDGILKSSIKHTLQICLYVFIITLVLNTLIGFVGENFLEKIFNVNNFLGPILASLIGLIPNCASSVVLSQLYADNIINISTLISGLLVNSGIGVLILFRTNKNLKENLKIITLLFLIGAISGILLNLIGFSI